MPFDQSLMKKLLGLEHLGWGPCISNTSIHPCIPYLIEGHIRPRNVVGNGCTHWNNDELELKALELLRQLFSKGPFKGVMSILRLQKGFFYGF